ncbi:MAG TPA: ATP-dependent sacrificial sulfur transferase LarE [Spirochaetota bacterium]|nr:ATP-dependent sacrificial sulfur transferase LarE [Spirochaetota bacterium]HPS85123.1 ATP-dependent sacrificial sulfur transferase LarE [Spirochaetota bacterium]
MKTLSLETEKAFNKLKGYLSDLESAAVAYSGGVDSTLLLYTASIIPGLKLRAYTVKNVMIPEDEIDAAVKTGKQFGVAHQLIDVDILSFDNVASNTPERCYYCKTVILEKIINAASDHGIASILEGTHSGDINDYRPGLKAIHELGVISPLRDAGFDKNKIYELSAFLNLPTSGKESYPCLATRIPYGTPITSGHLKKAELAEKIIASFGFSKIRARIHGDILRIEIDEKMIPEITAEPVRKKVYSALQDAGFTYITLDLRGYRAGSMNLILEGQK